MYIVVFKEHYYPTVWEFQTKQEAQAKYDELFYEFDEGDPSRIYIAEVKSHHGQLADDVIWY